MTKRIATAAFLSTVVLTGALSAQRPPIGAAVRQFVKVDAPVIALTHARVSDGAGAPARADQTLVIRDGNIAALGDAARVAVPEGATVIDLTRKTVMPGLVMLHEHLYYPTGRFQKPRILESMTSSTRS